MNKLLLSVSFLFCAFMMQAQTIGIVGPAANGWPDASNQTPDIMLTDNGDGTYSLTSQALNTGPAKFREDQQWTTSYGGDSFPSGNITNGDIPVQAGIYDIVLDLNNSTYSFTSVSGFTDLELAGTALDGANSPQFATTDGENYELTVTEFVDGDILIQEVATNNVFGATAFPSGTATAGGSAIAVTGGFYKVSFNLTSLAYSFDIAQIGIVGTAAAGWPDPATDPTPDIVMTSTNGDVYTLDNQSINDGELKFRQDLAWNVSWGGTDFAGGSIDPSAGNIVTTAGMYDVVFSRGLQTYSFTTATASLTESSFNQFKVYPNPSSEAWFFENPTQSIKSIAVFDQLGKLVFENQPNAIRGEVSTSVFSQGLYLAKVSLTDGSETTVKLYKK